MKSKEIVLFGATHTGKSTLGGYLCTAHYSEELYNRNLSDIKKEIEDANIIYDVAQELAYFMDKMMIERDRPDEGNSTSKKVHYGVINQNIVKFGIIDTPGTQSKTKERFKSLVLGEIGVFVVEIPKLLKLYAGDFSRDSYNKLINEYLSHLFLWLTMRGPNDLIIVITKMDRCNYSCEDYNSGVAFLRYICENDDIPIIPISINVAERKGHNILRKSSKMPWFNGLCLLDEVVNVSNKERYTHTDNNLLMCIEHTYENKLKHIGRTWTCKIINGKLAVNDVINFFPVMYKDQLVKATAKVKSIMIEDTRIITQDSGINSIVGIDIKDVFIDGNERKKINKRELKTKGSTLILNSNARYAKADTIQIKVDISKIEDWKKTELKTKVHIFSIANLVWFGKLITGKIFFKSITGNFINMVIKFDSQQIALPLLDNNEYVITRFSLQLIKYDPYEKPENRNVDYFIPIEIAKIGFIDNVLFNGSIVYQNNYLNELDNINQIRKFIKIIKSQDREKITENNLVIDLLPVIEFGK